jgi:hypothetical protein
MPTLYVVSQLSDISYRLVALQNTDFKVRVGCFMTWWYILTSLQAAQDYLSSIMPFHQVGSVPGGVNTDDRGAVAQQP